MAKKTSGTGSWLTRTAQKLLNIADIFAPHVDALIMVGLRVWVAMVFWQSGLTKISDWETTISLFQDEYMTPLLSPEIAASISSFFELSMPVLLIIGFATRLATLPLLGMTVVIQYSYMSHPDHLIWALFLGAILIKGPGLYSWDYFIRSKIRGGERENNPLSVIISMLAVIALTVVAGHEVAATQTEMTPWLEAWNKFWFGK